MLMLGATGRWVLALGYWDHANPMLRNAAAAVYGILSLGLVCVLASWQPENRVLAYASIDGDRVTLHNIRNFDDRSETDFTPCYYDRTFDLRQWRSFQSAHIGTLDDPASTHPALPF